MPLTQNERRALLAAGGAALLGFLIQNRKLNQIQRQLDKHDEDVYWRSVHETRHLQAWTWLTDTVEFNAPLPLMRGWAISPDFAAYYVELIREFQPQQIVELGGGTSTVISGTVLKTEQDEGQVIAVEAMETFADLTRQQLKRHEVENVAEVIHAPLVRSRVGRRHWPWYDIFELADIPPIDFLLVDGPAQFRNPVKMARYPAIPLLWPRIKAGALILMDDSARPDEQQVVKRWLSEFPSLEVVEERDDLEKGAVLLRKNL
jgi:predicted O-methyltransferase YrrM